MHYLNRLSSGDMAAVVFDATGNRQAMEAGPDYLAHGGRFVLVGLYRGVLTFDHPGIHSKEASILCSRNATRDDFQSVVALLQKKRFPLEAYVTHEVTHRDMISHFNDWLRPELGVIKAMVDF
jgi:threonine dehydrogenase-like Zn-dependent dehydrogenase